MSVPSTNDHKKCPKNTPYVFSNWCYMDSLDGKELADKEILEVTWPDGSITTERISVRLHYDTICDMGHDTQIPVSEAYVTAPVRGANMKVRLIEAINHAKRVKG